MKNNNNLSLFLYSQILSSFGFNLINFAILFHILDFTGSATRFAISISVGLLSKAIFLQISGVVSDFFEKKKLFVFFEVLYLILCVTMLLFNNNSMSYFILIFCYAAINGIRSISLPVTKSIIPAIVDQDGLAQANSYEVSNDKIARVFGPMLAAVLGFKVSLCASLVIYILTVYIKTYISIDSAKLKDNNISLKKIYINFIEGFYATFSNKLVLLLLINAVLTQVFFHSFIYTNFPIFLKFLSLSEVSIISKIIWFLTSTSDSVWKILNSWIQLGGAVGVIFSVFAITRLQNKSRPRLGLDLGIYGISICGILMGLAFFYFQVFHISAVLFINIVFLINVLLFFFFNVFTIFFSVYYQQRIAKEKLGRFVANFLFIFAITSSVGTMIYGYLATLGWAAPIMFLMFGSVLKVLIHLVFIRYERREGI